MAMVQLESYNFSTIENPLSNGGKFTTIADSVWTGTLKAIAGNLCEPTGTSVNAGSFWSGSVVQSGGVWPADQYSEITLTTASAATAIFYCVVRQQSATSGTQYLAQIIKGASGSWALYAQVAGSLHVLSTAFAPVNQGDVWRLAVVGNVLTLSQNGSVITTFTDSVYMLPAGTAGFGLNSQGGAITTDQTGLWAAGANQAATPTFNPVAGSYATAQNVQISSSTPGGLIYYTTDGSTPTHSSSSIANGGTVAVSTPLTIKAFASVTNFADSATGSATYSGTLTSSGNSSFLSVANNNALRGVRH